jgi:FkbM family methyltransferase
MGPPNVPKSNNLPFSPRSILLISIGFAMGAFLSTFSARVNQIGSSIGIRLPRSFTSFTRPRASSKEMFASEPSSVLSGRAASPPQREVKKEILSSVNSAPIIAPAKAPISSKAADMREICNNTAAETEGPREWHVFQKSEFDEAEYPCYWTNLTHWQLTYYHQLRPIKMCTHNPEVDTVISSHLHKWGFWGATDEFMLLLNINPCTKERPYMLDIGANIGLFTLIGAEKGCHVLAFEPLSDNIQRTAQSLIANGYWDRVQLFKHAVGKFFTTVRIGFRPGNPGSSGINLGGSKTERMEQITIDGLLLGHSPPSFPDKSLPKIEGKYINFIKVDTEGYDVAVIAGMMKTLIEGKVPHMLVEFGPSDAAGTAGCDPIAFVEMMYANGYSMYDFARKAELPDLVGKLLPDALAGNGRRVFEAWFILDSHAGRLMGKDGKLNNEASLEPK